MGDHLMKMIRSDQMSFFLLSVLWCILNQPSEALADQMRLGRLNTQGVCQDFTRELCPELSDPFKTIFIEDEKANEYHCQDQCRENNKNLPTFFDILRQGGRDTSTNTKKCRFFIYDRRKRMCELYDYSIYKHDHMCNQIGGPPLPYLTRCDSAENPDCLNMLEMDCSYKDYRHSQQYIHSARHCQRDCEISTYCKFFIYIEERYQCELLGSAERECNKVRGPPESKDKGCGLQSTTSKPTPTTTTPPPPTTPNWSDWICSPSRGCFFFAVHANSMS